MKRIPSIFGLAILLFCAFALLAADFTSLRIPAVQVTVSDFTLDYSPASRAVTLMPNAGGSILSGTSDANGLVGFARVTPGLYTLTIAGIGLDPLTLRVPNQSGTLSASNLVISARTPPSGAPYAAATDNLRAWSLLTPSAKQNALASVLDAANRLSLGTNLTFNVLEPGGFVLFGLNDTNANAFVTFDIAQADSPYDTIAFNHQGGPYLRASTTTGEDVLILGLDTNDSGTEDTQSITTGQGEVDGYTIKLGPADGAEGSGGHLILYAASATSVNEDGGSVTITAGDGDGAGYPGNVEITPGIGGTVIINGLMTATDGMATNAAAFRVTTTDFVLGTRYTNSNQRAFVTASIQLAAAVAGTATASLFVEHTSGITNKVTISAGPLASLTTTEQLFLPVGPGAVYRFEDEDSGSGAASAIVAGTSSITFD